MRLQRIDESAHRDIGDARPLAGACCPHPEFRHYPSRYEEDDDGEFVTASLTPGGCAACLDEYLDAEEAFEALPWWRRLFRSAPAATYLHEFGGAR